MTSFDGYQWLLDGSPLAGETSQAYTPAGAEVGHQLSCRVTVTYPLPLLVTTAATSAPVTVLASGPRPIPPSPPPVKATVEITKVKISSTHHRAKFSFKASGSVTGFQCALIKAPTGHRHKRPRPSFSACRSPKTYKHLEPGKYSFEVRAVTAAGPGTPAIKNFTIS